MPAARRDAAGRRGTGRSRATRDRNLATFVTTWMEPEAQRLIAENLYRNFIDHAEYPISAEIEQRCIRMLADLYNAPGETTGARTQGSSEAIMLGALSLKWKWRERREAAEQADRQAEPGLRRRRPRRLGEVLPLLRRRAADRAAAGGQVHDRARGRRAPRRREHDRRRRRPRHHLHRPRRRHRRHQRPAGRAQGREGPRRAAARRRRQRRLRLALPLPRLASGTSGSSRCARSTSPATSSGSSTRASAGSSSARKTTWPRTSSSTRTTWARPTRPSRSTSPPAPRWCSPSTTTSSASGARATRYVMEAMQANADGLAEKLKANGHFELIGDDEEQLPLVAFKLAGEQNYDEFDVSWQLSAERGWMLPAYTMPPDAEDVKIMRALVKQTLEPRPGRPPRRRHRRGLRDAREEGRRAPGRAQARPHRHRVLASADALPQSRRRARHLRDHRRPRAQADDQGSLPARGREEARRPSRRRRPQRLEQAVDGQALPHRPAREQGQGREGRVRPARQAPRLHPGGLRRGGVLPRGPHRS